MQGKDLSIEEIADILSLKDNVPSVEDYITALHVLLHANVSMEAFMTAIRFSCCHVSFLLPANSPHSGVSGVGFTSMTSTYDLYDTRMWPSY